MKKNIVISFILLMFFAMSCTDMLNETPISTLSPENIFTTMNDANTAVTGMYAGFVPYFATLTPVYGWGEHGTDIVQGSVTDQVQKFTKYSISSVSPSLDFVI